MNKITPHSFIFSLMLLFSLQAQDNSDSLSDLGPENFRYINYLFTDINGIPKEVTYPSHMAKTIEKEGFKFDGSSVPGMTNIRESDMTAMPNMNTLKQIPWNNSDEKIARVICDVLKDDVSPYKGDPRYVLKQAIAKAKNMGYDFLVGPELEFFICKEDIDGAMQPIDESIYFADNHNPFLNDLKIALFNALLAQDIAVEKIHHEVAPGQYEISIRYDDALKMSDQLIIAKQTIRAITKLFEYKTTFMPKPFFGQNGSGMHIHFSLWNRQTNSNAFYDPKEYAKLSKTGRQFIAGVLHHVREINAFLNPTVNSYKRLVPGYEAPTNVCWGSKNRSAMIRIPQVNNNQGKAVRAEIRSVDPMANPYIACAAILYAGLNGIENELELAEPVEDNLYQISAEERAHRNIKALPGSLDEAISLLSNSSFANETLGNTLITEFIKAKQNELNSYNSFVTDWERNRYFEN